MFKYLQSTANNSKSLGTWSVSVPGGHVQQPLIVLVQGFGFRSALQVRGGQWGGPAALPEAFLRCAPGEAHQ